MGRSCAAFSIVVFALSVPLAAAPPPMSASEVGSLEDRLTIDAEDLEARARLLDYYFEKGDFGEWAQHELWLIANQPASDLHRSTAKLNPALAERLSTAWRKAVERPEASAGALRNAAKFFVEVDPARKPVLIFKTEPEYPAAAREVRIAGVVRLVVVIDVAGRVSRVQLENGHPLLAESAIAAVKKWRYEPTILSGVAVVAVTEVEVKFTQPKR